MSKLNVEKVSSVENRALPIFAEIDEMMDRVRRRAYERFLGRGRGDGRDLADWLEAEREICWPAAELAETDGAVELKVALAGFEPKEISVTATPHELIVKAAHESKRKGKDKSAKTKIRWSEFRKNDVYRRIELPAQVDVDRISAEYNQGLLVIEAPKSAEEEERERPTQIKVSSAA